MAMRVTLVPSGLSRRDKIRRRPTFREIGTRQASRSLELLVVKVVNQLDFPRKHASIDRVA